MNLLLTIHLFVTLSLIGVILLQRSEGGGGLVDGNSGGNNRAMFTARGAANLLTRITAVLAVLFIGNCLLMTILSSSQTRRDGSFLLEETETTTTKITKPEKPKQDNTHQEPTKP